MTWSKGVEFLVVAIGFCVFVVVYKLGLVYRVFVTWA